jgi:hypothetical protein
MNLNIFVVLGFFALFGSALTISALKCLNSTTHKQTPTNETGELEGEV